MTTARYVLHPGLPKTGTTSLQSSIWPRSANYAGWQPWRDPELGPRFRDLVRADDADLSATRDLLERSRVDDAVPVVVSYESCTWQTFAAPGSSLHRVDGWERARRVRELLGPDTEVLIAVREQRRWLLSAYRFLLELGLADSLRTFLEHHDALLASREPGGCDIAALVDTYADLFGPERVHLLPFEALLDDSPTAWSTIASTLGLAPGAVGRDQLAHERPTPLGPPLGAVALANKLRRRSGYGAREDEWGRIRWLVRHAQIPVLSPRSLQRARTRIDEFVRSRPAIGTGNRALAARTGYDLDAYGYV
jgi:hypothetical protein